MSTTSLLGRYTVRNGGSPFASYTDGSAYLKHDIERAIIIDFDLHHGKRHSYELGLELTSQATELKL